MTIHSIQKKSSTSLKTNHLSAGTLNSKGVRNISQEIKKLHPEIDRLDADEKKKQFIWAGILAFIATASSVSLIAFMSFDSGSSSLLKPVLGLFGFASLRLIPTAVSAYYDARWGNTKYKQFKTKINQKDFYQFIIDKNVEIHQQPFSFKKLTNIFNAYERHKIAEQIRDSAESFAIEAEKEALQKAKIAHQKAEAKAKKAQKIAETAEKHAREIANKTKQTILENAQLFEEDCNYFLRI